MFEFLDTALLMSPFIWALILYPHKDKYRSEDLANYNLLGMAASVALTFLLVKNDLILLAIAVDVFLMYFLIAVIYYSVIDFMFPIEKQPEEIPPQVIEPPPPPASTIPQLEELLKKNRDS